MMKALKRLLREETGNFLTEYAFMTALVSIVAAGVLGFMNHYTTRVENILESIFQALH